MRDSGDFMGVEVDERWQRFGWLVGLANLVFILVLIVLLRVDVVLGLAFAIVGGAAGGFVVMFYALRRM